MSKEERTVAIPRGIVTVPKSDERRIMLDAQFAEMKVELQLKEEESNGEKEEGEQEEDQQEQGGREG